MPPATATTRVFWNKFGTGPPPLYLWLTRSRRHSFPESLAFLHFLGAQCLALYFGIRYRLYVGEPTFWKSGHAIWARSGQHKIEQHCYGAREPRSEISE